MARRPRVLLILLDACLLVVSSAACGSAGSGSTAAATVSAQDSQNDTLGAGDILQVRVYGQEDLSATVQVAGDGRVDLPLIGSVSVSGLDAIQAGDAIESALGDGGYLVDPHVTVFVEASNSRRVTVVGEVVRPGTFPLTPGLTLVQVISLAGGYTAMANRDATLVTRREDGELRRFRVEVDEITRGVADDVTLRPGDIVFVPQRIL